jgi:hypothetical protein
MAEYARVEGSTIIERREIANMPAHKAHLWRPVVYEGSGELSNVVVEADQVRVVRSDIPVDQVKAALLKKVDDDAGNVRAKYLSTGAGMTMTYQEKHSQARAVDDLGEQAANALTEAERDEQFPTLSASVGIEAATLWDCAQLVIQKYEQFADISRIIERTRLQGKQSISDASDAAAARAAYEAITWTA